jgi:hypothetical protein
MRRRRLPPERLASFVDLESRLLEMLRPDLAAGIIWRVLLKDPAQQIAAAGHREADREGELIAKRAVIHQGRFQIT